MGQFSCRVIARSPLYRHERAATLPMPPLRVLHVTPYFNEAWGYGGIPRLAHSLARGLSRRGHHVTVCTTDAGDASARLDAPPCARTADGVEVRTFANASNRLAYHWQLF